MTRAELEARRLSAIPDLQGDVLSAAAIAKRYGVSRVTVYRWQNAILANGEDGLKIHRAPGRPSRINDAQRAAICRLFRRERWWTQSRFADALSNELGIEYSPDHVGRIMHRLGLVPTKARP